MVSSVPILTDELERLEALYEYDLLDTEAEQRFDDLTQLASFICGTPVALVSLVDKERQWFKSKVGIDASEIPREYAFCAHAIAQPEQLLVVPDAQKDPRFAQNPLVTGPTNVRFYAGAPLVTEDGYALGTLCVIDNQPRELTSEQLQALSAVRRQVLAQIELSRNLLDLNRANIELTRLNQTKNDFLHMAAHDLKNPLSAVMGYAEELQEDSPCEEAQEMGQQIYRASRHMYELVTNLLDVNTIESQHEQELELKALDLTDLFQHIEQHYQKRALAKQLNLQVNLAADASVIMANEFALQQVLDNLVSNAIKYSPAEREVHLLSLATEEYVEVVVRDFGPGFSEEDKAHLFQKFTRLSAKPTGGEHSSGLGLFIVKRLVDAMHAEIECDSALGQGTSFILRFQRAKN